MTIAVVLKIGDGIILGADSASSMFDGSGVANVYFNAEKVANLYKGLPIGMLTWGLGALDSRSISSLAKDLRERLRGEDPAWHIDKENYTIEQVADRVKVFFCEELYRKEYPRKVPDGKGGTVDSFPGMGFLVAGYSSGQRKAEVWTVEVDESGQCTKTLFLDQQSFGAEAKGQPEALMRLVNGWSPRVLDGMVNSGIPVKDAEQFLSSLPMEPLVDPGMPIQDAIDLVKYLVSVTEGFVRFIPGAPTVHEPIDIAAITYHEGFRWVQRKHYFSSELNPPLD